MDMETLMAQAQSLQAKINEAQDSLAQMHVKGIADNGTIVIDMTGKYDVESVVVLVYNSERLFSGGGKV